MNPRTILIVSYLSELGPVEVAKEDISDMPLLEIEVLLEHFSNRGLNYEIQEE